MRAVSGEPQFLMIKGLSASQPDILASAVLKDTSPDGHRRDMANSCDFDNESPDRERLGAKVKKFNPLGSLRTSILDKVKQYES